MKTLFAALGLFAVAALVNIAPASAAQYGPPSTGNWHYEWQYHYVGHHSHYKAGWVLVR